MSERPQPLKAINRLFEGKEPWQIVTMTASSILAIVWAHSLYNAKESVTTRLRKEFFRWLRQVPIVRRKIDEKMAEINSDFRKDVTKRLAGVTVRRELPETGLDPEQVMEEVRDHVALGAYDWQNGSVSGAVYHVSQEISKVACDAYSLTAYTNPLHADVFPGINKMEAEVVRMAINLFHGDDDCCGTVTTGGTESIIMACKAFRDLAYSKGISNPQIIVPSTVHSAFDKAAQYLGLSVKTIPVNPDTMTVDVEKVKRAIGRRTCLIVGSAPNYPYGTMDDIIALSDIAVEYDVPLHVDACLGGFVAAFMNDAGHHVPVFDFRLPGVSSISADTHKYGFAPKGTSVILYRKQEYRHHQYTVTTEWPGGVYGSPTVNGSRAGGLIAACWATMMYVGKARYVQMTDEVIRTARHIENEVRKIPGLFVFGKPATSVVAFGSNKFDIFKMAELLHKKGWSLNALQFPSGIHICVTHAHTHAGIAERFLADTRDAAAACMKDSNAPVEGKMAIYGVAQEISDRSLVSDITKYFIDSMYYLPKEEDQIKSNSN
ncbi:sphingosine-1-phosphate lyase [Helicoverpa zea]|uniref:sphingosine-1-phosphate lyase n=1 Tax=Helicoverpa zea TaxID=7113 RepID=UPI001F55B129|nr:sphingosine-1-phosphate lyase [Helicoverpa zea]XP_047022422.1 sphingosine-1-phosphate lyase [Helicoverpa zea]